jgi:putative transposase
MARLARIAAVNIPCHVTQRGNARQFLLTTDEERSVYLDLLRKNIRLHELRLLAYCLMSNHVHLVVIPEKSDSLAQVLKQTHGRYATYWNATHGSSGHVWQGRFYSCPMDQNHLWIALRYVERNPVRAGLVRQTCEWRWSSAAVHCGEAADEFLDCELWNKRWSATSWKEYLSTEEPSADIDAIRRSTHTGRPLGGDDFVQSLEAATQRTLTTTENGGRKRNASSAGQTALAFEK